MADKTNHNKPKATQTAAECYTARHAECEKRLKRIAFQLDVHRGCQAQEPTNWGHAGDLGRVTEELAYVLADLGDRRALDQQGLKY